MTTRMHRPSQVRTYAISLDLAEDWRTRGLCLKDDPERWFPVGKTGSHRRVELAEEAKEICRTCPVVEKCLNWALDKAITDGIFGGADEDERDEMLRGDRPREVPLPQWTACRDCGEKRIRPGATGRNLTCQECRDKKASQRRLEKLRQAAARQATPAPTAVADPPAPPALGLAEQRRQERLWSRAERDAAKHAIVSATRRIVLASRGELAS